MAEANASELECGCDGRSGPTWTGVWRFLEKVWTGSKIAGWRSFQVHTSYKSIKCTQILLHAVDQQSAESLIDLFRFIAEKETFVLKKAKRSRGDDDLAMLRDDPIIDSPSGRSNKFGLEMGNHYSYAEIQSFLLRFLWQIEVPKIEKPSHSESHKQCLRRRN